MLPNPLHPAVVHFPVVFAFLLPLVAAGTMFVIRRGAKIRRAWLLPLSFAAGLAASSWLAVETGEDEEGKVEKVLVTEEPLSAHEDMAETFLSASVVLVLVASAGLLGGIPGRTARIVTLAGSLILAGGAARVGHSGGKLVYSYGAASAYPAVTPGVLK